MTKIVCISDTHLAHSQLEIPECDLLIHAGDFSFVGKMVDVMDVNQWFGKLKSSGKVKQIICCAGNHDWICATNPIWTKEAFTNCIYLDEESCEVFGLKVFGSAWSPEFNDWAFNAKRGKEIARHWAKIPEDTQLLVTHCTIPIYKTLTYDLRWKQLGDLKVGDELIAFDEFSRQSTMGRCYRKSIVTYVNFKKAPTYRVFLSDGTKFEVTANHLWLGTYGAGNNHCHWNRKWLSTMQLQPLNKYGKTRCTKLRKIFDVWTEQTDWEAGYIAGIFDGEGFMSPQWNFDMGFAQNPGIVLDTMVSCLQNKGFKVANYPKETGWGKICRSINIRGDIPNKLRLLGAYRPKRLLQKFTLDNFNYRLRSFKEAVLVEAIEPGPEQEIVEIKTSTGTLIIDGFPMHNSPPMGILDVNTEEPYSLPLGPVHLGCEELRKRVDQLKDLKLSVFGHIHSSSGVELHNRVQFVNASVLNESYEVVYPPRVITL